MKKIFSFLLAALMLFSLAACGDNQQTGTNTTVPAGEKWTGGFSVGYAREDVTPPIGTVIYGMGNAGVTNRVSVDVLRPICITCVAVTDETGATVLMYTFDIQSLSRTNVNALRKKVSEAIGLAREQISISATHTHSSAELAGPWYDVVVEAAIKTAKDALADRSAATISTGSTEVKNMSFVRHYTTTSGRVIGDNFSEPGYGSITGHTTQAEDLLQVINFNRADKKPVIMVNWQAHASMSATGSTSFGLQNRNKLSSDYVGACREYVEAVTGGLFAFYLAASGNINPLSAIAAENGTEHPDGYGKRLGQYVELCLKDLNPMDVGAVEYNTVTYKGVADNGTARQMDIGVVGISKLGFVLAPYEMFDTSGTQIRENSPYEMTFVLTCTNGAESYIPTQECWDYIGCYEVGVSHYKRGTAEILVGEYGKLLDELYK